LRGSFGRNRNLRGRQKACGPLRKRLFGAKRFASVVAVAGADHGFALAVERAVGSLSRVGSASLGVILGDRLAPGFLSWFRLRAHDGPARPGCKRGVPATLADRPIAIEDAALVLDTPGVTMTRLAWSGISRKSRRAGRPGCSSDRAGLFPADPFVSPMPPPERPSWPLVLRKLTPEARARSIEAVALTGTSSPKA
jgi:hypothetical protein